MRMWTFTDRVLHRLALVKRRGVSQEKRRIRAIRRSAWRKWGVIFQNLSFSYASPMTGGSRRLFLLPLGYHIRADFLGFSCGSQSLNATSYCPSSQETTLWSWASVKSTCPKFVMATTSPNLQILPPTQRHKLLTEGRSDRQQALTELSCYDV